MRKKGDPLFQSNSEDGKRMVISHQSDCNDYYYEIINGVIEFIGYSRKSEWKRERFVKRIKILIYRPGKSSSVSI